MQGIEIAIEILHLRQTCLIGEALSKTRKKLSKAPRKPLRCKKEYLYRKNVLSNNPKK
jgi:hypothetical protein